MGNFSDTLTITSSLGGRMQITRSGDVRLPIAKSLPAGVAGHVESVVDTTTVLTLASGHGITDASIVGVFWAAGQRLGLTVTAYTATSITVTTASGTGDALPSIADTAIVVSARVLEDDVAYDGTAAQMLSIGANHRVGVEMLDAAGDSVLTDTIAIAEPPTVGEGEGFIWATGIGFDNPMSAVVASTEFYNGSTTPATVNMGILIA